MSLGVSTSPFTNAQTLGLPILPIKYHAQKQHFA